MRCTKNVWVVRNLQEACEEYGQNAKLPPRLQLESENGVDRNSKNIEIGDCAEDPLGSREIEIWLTAAVVLLVRPFGRICTGYLLVHRNAICQ